jgi:L-serine deaminase
MVRVGAVSLLVLAISWMVYLVATVGLSMALVVAIAAIALSIHVLLTCQEVTGYVKKYDNSRHQGSGSR